MNHPAESVVSLVQHAGQSFIGMAHAVWTIRNMPCLLKRLLPLLNIHLGSVDLVTNLMIELLECSFGEARVAFLSCIQ